MCSVDLRVVANVDGQFTSNKNCDDRNRKAGTDIVSQVQWSDTRSKAWTFDDDNKLLVVFRADTNCGSSIYCVALLDGLLDADRCDRAG